MAETKSKREVNPVAEMENWKVRLLRRTAEAVPCSLPFHLHFSLATRCSQLAPGVGGVLEGDRGREELWRKLGLPTGTPRGVQAPRVRNPARQVLLSRCCPKQQGEFMQPSAPLVHAGWAALWNQLVLTRAYSVLTVIQAWLVSARSALLSRARREETRRRHRPKTRSR